MIDPFGRSITYLRVSVTDRCDLRCLYCMPERMQFLPKAELLTLAELERVTLAFIRLGVRRLRVTGGEPLTRRDVPQFIRRLGTRIGHGLEELTLTTNGTRLAGFAQALRDAGVERVNVSLDTLDRDRFRRLTRGGDLDAVMAGLDAATAAGLQIKINTVALRGENEAELPGLIEWAHGRGFDLTLIETMPLGEIGEDRTNMFLPLSAVRDTLAKRWTLTPAAHRTGGPARYVTVGETGGRLGFITPLTGNFCDGCNRVRLTCTGRLYLCLGREEAVDLRELLREGTGDGALERAILAAIGHKPKGHSFDIAAPRPSVSRHMSMTGG